MNPHCGVCFQGMGSMTEWSWESTPEDGTTISKCLEGRVLRSRCQVGKG